MQKLTYLFVLLFAASVVFTSCSSDDYRPDLSLIRDEGVVIGALPFMYPIGAPAAQQTHIGYRHIIWATRNVGARGTFALAPESAGMFFQWNRPQAWAATGEAIGWNSIPASSPTGAGTTGSWAGWLAANDPCPPGWRVPTLAELTQLRAAGHSELTQLRGVYGRFFGTYPNRIFLPAAGFRFDADGSVDRVGSWGYYWSNSAFGANQRWFLQFSDTGSAISRYDGAWGFNVRCVNENFVDVLF